MAYQLYRTNVALTGNVKLGCYITSGKIDHCVLNPLSSRLPISPFNINISGSKYGADLVKFYKKHTLDFYAPDLDPLVTEVGDFKSYTENDKFFNPCPGDGQYGLKRVSYQKNDKQLSLFAPVFINSENDIPAYVRFTTGIPSDRNMCTRTVKIADTALGDYLKRSLANLNGGSDYPHIINTDISASYSIVRGLSMLSGGMLNVKSDLLSRVLDHDMTYREFNAYICDEFKRYNLICPWIINFCWYFDVDDILASRSINAVSDFDNLIITCEYLDKDKNKISFGDLDFNDYNISGNVLGRLNDPKTSVQLNDRVSMIQPTANSWSIGNTDYIFNTYLGFDALDKDGVPTDTITPDIPYNIDYFAKTVIANAHNLDWMHIIDTYRAQTVAATATEISLEKFVNDLKAVYYGDYLKRYIITNSDDCFCNGCKFNVTGFFDTIKNALGESVEFADNYKLSLSLLNNSVDTDLNPPFNFILLTYDDSNTKITAVDFVVFNPHKENYTGQYTSALNDYVAARLNKSIERKDPYDTIFLRAASSKYVTWKVLDNTEWVDISDSLGNPRVPIYFGKGGLGVEVPKGFYTNNILTSKDNSNGIYTLYQTNSQIHINRYFGWIQPHIETDVTKIYTFAKHYLKADQWWTDGDGNKRQWGDGIDVIPLSEVKTYYPQVYTDRADTITIPEWKGYGESRCVVTPKEFSITVPMEKNSITVSEAFDNYIKETYGEDTYSTIVNNNWYDYIHRLYSFTTDINDDKTEYIITFKLK